ncbi:hypothetical protein AAVH_02437 [Aphelenchoides avenae]|nr:hypothetical protein AAVH_02437 [Aphelenchus avenae]
MNLLAGLLQALFFLTAVNAQHPYQTFASKKHLHGIRRLPYQRYLARDEGGPSGTGRPGVIFFSSDTANGSGGSYGDPSDDDAEGGPPVGGPRRPSAPTAMRIYGNSASSEVLVPVNPAYMNGVRKVPSAAVPPSFAITPDTNDAQSGATTAEPVGRVVRPQAPRQRISVILINLPESA